MTYRYLLGMTLPLLLVSAFALLKGIPKLVSAMRVKPIAELPLAGSGSIEIAQSGELILSLRSRLGSTDFASATFSLLDATGAAVPSSTIRMRSSRTGMDGQTMLSVRRFAVAAPGRYRLEVAGIDPLTSSADSRLLLTRPRGASLIGPILWVVVAGGALLVSVIFSGIAVFAPSGPRTDTPAVGSPVYVGAINAVQAHLGVSLASGHDFRVFHLKTNGQWTYFEGNQIVPLDDHEWQETDLTVKALFEFEGKVLRIRAFWSLPENHRFSLQEFERQVADFRRSAHLPESLFPESPIPATDPNQMTRVRIAPGKPEPTPEVKNRIALWAAIKEYDLAGVQAAVAQGADCKEAGEFQRTPLHEAVCGVNVRLVQWLLENGADPHALDDDGRTPLHRANEHHLSALLSHGADLHALDHQGNTALHIAAERNFSVPMCKALVQAGISVNACNHAGLTPLHFAVLHGKEDNLAALIELGADVNARTTGEYDYKGFYAHWTVVETGQLLPAGLTPVSLARRLHKQAKWVSSRYKMAAEFLVSKGAVER